MQQIIEGATNDEAAHFIQCQEKMTGRQTGRQAEEGEEREEKKKEKKKLNEMEPHKHEQMQNPYVPSNTACTLRFSA
jgi:hypothetical protein